MEHGVSGERQPESEEGAQEGVGRDGAGGVQAVAVDEEVDALLEDDVEAGS